MSGLVAYSKKTKRPIVVEITGDGEKRCFKLSAEEYSNKIKRYCVYYETDVTYRKCIDYHETVRFANGIEFNAELYYRY